jgi:hypothetical protein
MNPLDPMQLAVLFQFVQRAMVVLGVIYVIKMAAAVWRVTGGE